MTPTALLDRPVPDIDDDLTRRELIAGGAALGLLAACGRSGRDESGQPGTTLAEATSRRFQYALGVPDVPVRPSLAADAIVADV